MLVYLPEVIIIWKNSSLIMVPKNISWNPYYIENEKTNKFINRSIFLNPTTVQINLFIISNLPLFITKKLLISKMYNRTNYNFSSVDWKYFF